MSENSHSRAEELAAAAEMQMKYGNKEAARQLYGQAGAAEAEAVVQVAASESRTRGILSVSAVSLYFKAELFDVAERLAFTYLSGEDLPGFAREQLRDTLQALWEERELRSKAVALHRIQSKSPSEAWI
jgi:hypothetical protein